MSLKMKFAKLWVLFVLLLGGVMITPASTMVASADEQTIAALLTSDESGTTLMGECASGSTCGA